MSKIASRCSPHGWTLDTLEKYLIRQIDSVKETLVEHDERNKERFQAAKESVASALQAANTATTKAESASDIRFQSVNEFRGALSDQAKSLLPRDEYTLQHQNLLDKLGDITARTAALEASSKGRHEGMSSFGAIMVGVAVGTSALISLATLAFNILRH